MTRPRGISRRSACGILIGAAGAAVAAGSEQKSAESGASPPFKGRLKQSVCRWCYGKISLDDLCRQAAAIGLKSVELVGPQEWPTLKKYGLTCAMPGGPGSIGRGWNRVEHHDELVKRSEELLPQIAAAGLPNMIVMSGNRAGISDDEGLKNCAKGLARITPLAEKLGVTLCIELLNSKRDHKDYQCDHTAWAVELAKRVASNRFKILYDIYHMQIMEGDVIATIQENISYIGHFHTGGVPGRNEIDETQELNYRRIAQAIVDTGYAGYVGQEFIPTRDPIESLRAAVQIMDV
jgi:hydroxypyruvate isomerase